MLPTSAKGVIAAAGIGEEIRHVTAMVLGMADVERHR